MPMLLRACVLASALGLASLSSGQAQERGPVVIVTGEASVGVAPDTAIIRAGVVNDAKSAREASDANSRLMGPVIAALKEAGVADPDIQTSRLTVQPVHEQARAGTPRIGGFRASNQVRATVRDVARVAEVLDRAVTAGANDISGVTFLVANPSKALDAVRGRAIADARRKAEIYAKAAGVGLGRAVTIDEERSSRGPIPLQAARMEAAPIAPGEQNLGVSVTVTFELLY